MSDADEMLAAARNPDGSQRFYPRGQHPATKRLRDALAWAEGIENGTETTDAYIEQLRRQLAAFERGEDRGKIDYIRGASTTANAKRSPQEVELDSLRGRVAVLEAALRELAYTDVVGDRARCVACKAWWSEYPPTQHEPGCFIGDALAGAVLAGGDAAAEEKPQRKDNT